jgi:hypothetical protein
MTREEEIANCGGEINEKKQTRLLRAAAAKPPNDLKRPSRSVPKIKETDILPLLSDFCHKACMIRGNMLLAIWYVMDMRCEADGTSREGGSWQDGQLGNGAFWVLVKGGE